MHRWCVRVQLALTAAALLVVASVGAIRAETVALVLESAALAYDMRTNEPIVNVRFTPAARQAFAEFTRKNVGRPVSLLVDGQVVITTTIREPIEGGSGQLSGGFTVERAKELAARLSSGQSKLEVRNAD